MLCKSPAWHRIPGVRAYQNLPGPGHEYPAPRIIGELARLGIRFSFDDFDTIKNLKQVSVQKLKIDQSFIRNLPHDPDGAVVVHATIAIGHQLGLRVVAEGLETEDQFVFLKDHGCDEGQGFYFHRPLPPDTMGDLLRSEASGQSDRVTG